jgi:hypothetical protein
MDTRPPLVKPKAINLPQGATSPCPVAIIPGSNYYGAAGTIAGQGYFYYLRAADGAWTGSYVKLVKHFKDKPSYPAYIATETVDAKATWVWVADGGQSQVSYFKVGGTAVEGAASFPAAWFNEETPYPRTLAWDPDTRLMWVADRQGGRVAAFATAGMPQYPVDAATIRTGAGTSPMNLQVGNGKVFFSAWGGFVGYRPATPAAYSWTRRDSYPDSGANSAPVEAMVLDGKSLWFMDYDTTSRKLWLVPDVTSPASKAAVVFTMPAQPFWCSDLLVDKAGFLWAVGTNNPASIAMLFRDGQRVYLSDQYVFSAAIDAKVPDLTRATYIPDKDQIWIADNNGRYIVFTPWDAIADLTQKADIGAVPAQASAAPDTAFPDISVAVTTGSTKLRDQAVFLTIRPEGVAAFDRSMSDYDDFARLVTGPDGTVSIRSLKVAPGAQPGTDFQIFATMRGWNAIHRAPVAVFNGQVGSSISAVAIKHGNGQFAVRNTPFERELAVEVSGPGAVAGSTTIVFAVDPSSQGTASFVQAGDVQSLPVACISQGTGKPLLAGAALYAKSGVGQVKVTASPQGSQTPSATFTLHVTPTPSDLAVKNPRISFNVDGHQASLALFIVTGSDGNVSGLPVRGAVVDCTITKPDGNPIPAGDASYAEFYPASEFGQNPPADSEGTSVSLTTDAQGQVALGGNREHFIFLKASCSLRVDVRNTSLSRTLALEPDTSTRRQHGVAP